MVVTPNLGFRFRGSIERRRNHLGSRFGAVGAEENEGDPRMLGIQSGKQKLVMGEEEDKIEGEEEYLRRGRGRQRQRSGPTRGSDEGRRPGLGMEVREREDLVTEMEMR